MNQSINIYTRVKHLPKGGNPPATVEDEGLRAFRDSILEYDSESGAADLLPVFMACDKFYSNIPKPLFSRLVSSDLYIISKFIHYKKI